MSQNKSLFVVMRAQGIWPRPSTTGCLYLEFFRQRQNTLTLINDGVVDKIAIELDGGHTGRLGLFKSGDNRPSMRNFLG